MIVSNFKTMAERFPDYDTKELQQFKENAENSKRKALRPGLPFGLHGLKKKDTVRIL